jgi:hypothetical protein
VPFSLSDFDLDATIPTRAAEPSCVLLPGRLLTFYFLSMKESFPSVLSDSLARLDRATAILDDRPFPSYPVIVLIFGWLCTVNSSECARQAVHILQHPAASMSYSRSKLGRGFPFSKHKAQPENVVSEFGRVWLSLGYHCVRPALLYVLIIHRHSSHIVPHTTRCCPGGA